MPEVYCRASDARLRQLLSRHAATEEETEAMVRHVEERGSVYLPQVNVFYVREFKMTYVAEEAARFLHHACRGLPRKGKHPGPRQLESFLRSGPGMRFGIFRLASSVPGAPRGRR